MFKEVWSEILRTIKVGSDDGKEPPSSTTTLRVRTLVIRGLFDDLAVDFISKLRVSMAVLQENEN